MTVWKICLHKSNHPASTHVRHENAFYVILISESTGKPKGCIVNGTVKLAETWNMTTSSHVFQLVRHAFDMKCLNSS